MEWTGARYADKPAVEARIWIDASPARVWRLVSDVELMPDKEQKIVFVRMREFERNITATLEQIKKLAEA